jgi:hypothetical protein
MVLSTLAAASRQTAVLRTVKRQQGRGEGCEEDSQQQHRQELAH